MTNCPSVTFIKYYFYVFAKRVAYVAFHFNVLRGETFLLSRNSAPFVQLQDLLSCNMPAKITGFSCVTPCILVVISNLSALKMEAVCFSETSVPSNQTTRC